MARLFISYARQDQVFVRKLAADLQALGADIWLDVQDIAPGTKWSSAIQTGLDASEIMLVIVTPNSMSSTNVEDEWQYYLEQHKPVIPVLLERARMHFRLSPIQYVDFNMQPYEGGLRQLHERLKSLGIALQPVTDEFLAASRHLSPRPQSQPAASVPAGKKPQSAATRRSRGALIIGAGLLLVLIVAGIIVIPGVTSRITAQQTQIAAGSMISVISPPTATLTTVVPSTPAPIATLSATAASTDLPPGTTRTDANGIVQVRVPAGCFIMGTDPQVDKLGDLDEVPAHPVCLTHGFWIDQTEVTNTNFEKFVTDGGYSKKQYWDPAGWAYLQTNHFTGPVDYPGFDGPDQPQVGVTFYSAQAYARWRGGRLPTEAEWEYVARGPKSLVYPWDNTYNAGFANADGILGHTAPVGSYPKGDSWVGAHDMVGNVAEWTGDYYDGSYFTQLVKNDPPGAPRGDARVIKGGSWASTMKQTRAAFRGDFAPDYRDNQLGFRLVMPDS